MGSATGAGCGEREPALTLSSPSLLATATLWAHEATTENQLASNFATPAPGFLGGAIDSTREFLLTLDGEPASVVPLPEAAHFLDERDITMSDEELAHMLECDLQHAASPAQFEIPAASTTTTACRASVWATDRAMRHSPKLSVAAVLAAPATPMLAAPAVSVLPLRVPDMAPTRAQRVARYKAKRAQRTVSEPRRQVRCEERSDRARKRRRVSGRFMPSLTTWVSAS